MLARLGEHSDVVTNARSKSTPRPARRSRFGRFKKGSRWPGPNRSAARSSAMMTTKLGRPTGGLGALPGLDGPAASPQPDIDSAIAKARPRVGPDAARRVAG